MENVFKLGILEKSNRSERLIMIVIIINIYDHGHLIGEEHKEMVLVAALEDRLGCV